MSDKMAGFQVKVSRGSLKTDAGQPGGKLETSSYSESLTKSNMKQKNCRLPAELIQV